VNRPPGSLTLVAALTIGVCGVALIPANAWAQDRAVRRPAARPIVTRPIVVPVRPVVYRPYYPLGLHAGWYSWGGWSPYRFYGQPYPYPYPYPYPPRYYHPGYESAARILVEPRHAEVYVDGHFVGTVDDFDGWAQRLRVPPGERVLEIYLEGYRTYRQHVLFRPGASIRIQHALEPIAPGDPQEPRPTPSAAPAHAAPPPRYPSPPPRRDAPPPVRGDQVQDYGALAIRVQPMDAEVIVNGESWESPAAGDLTLQLSEGTHHVEVRKEGYRPYTAEIQVRRGETARLNVSLSRR
jgi:hypothetical protein